LLPTNRHVMPKTIVLALFPSPALRRRCLSADLTSPAISGFILSIRKFRPAPQLGLTGQPNLRIDKLAAMPHINPVD